MDKLLGTIVKKADISGTVSLPYSANYYTGDYDITPTIDGQVMETANKTMVEDVTINPIPYEEVTNLGGGITATIGGY